ncbi:TIGR02281 family clan AA aspartic protease [Erythrobacter sp. AP23]|uniref:retropepsin-like aspartic protease family protein n=1 Tax=Erythrobacter sp. AP23 TaxID=499656 RepID=UPI000AE15BE2|nr:TIGR02281 family clan AA aspartic protease [Erythrobacter sp. AP23]
MLTAMRELALLAVAIAAFVAAAFVPGGALDSASEKVEDLASVANGRTQVPAVRQSGSDDSYAAWVAGTTELPRAADGHFYADVSVNGAQVEFLVDTGASVIALTGADARAAGLYWSDADISVVARGASGPVQGVEATLDRVELGGHVARDVRAVIVPEGLAISLLGQSFLATVQPVRIDADRMVLSE